MIPGLKRGLLLQLMHILEVQYAPNVGVLKLKAEGE